MQLAKKVSVGIAAAGMLFWGLTSTAFADGEYSPAQEAPAEEGRKFTWSITLAGTSDYIFRGLSLSNEDPAFQPAINFGYGIFYVGAWGSNLYSPDVAGPWETDFYAGIKPVWGPVTFDFGTVYYTYFGQEVDFDYIEFKAGASFSPFTNFTVTPIFWWTPEPEQLRRDLDHRGHRRLRAPGLRHLYAHDQRLGWIHRGHRRDRCIRWCSRQLHLLERWSGPCSREVHLRLPLLGHEPRFSAGRRLLRPRRRALRVHRQRHAAISSSRQISSETGSFGAPFSFGGKVLSTICCARDTRENRTVDVLVFVLVRTSRLSFTNGS